MFVHTESQDNESSDRVEEAIRNGWSVMIKTINKDSYVPMFVFYCVPKTKKSPVYDLIGEDAVS